MLVVVVAVAAADYEKYFGSDGSSSSAGARVPRQKRTIHCSHFFESLRINSSDGDGHSCLRNLRLPTPSVSKTRKCDANLNLWRRKRQRRKKKQS